MTSPRSYPIPSTDEEVHRLALQAEMVEPAARALLDELGDLRGQQVADVACGPVGLLPLLSQAVGPRGRVVGTDVDPRMTEAAARLVRELGLGNVELLVDDVLESQLAPGSMDLVHARFLLTPLGRHAELFPSLKRLVRPGGTLALQETIGLATVLPEGPGLEALFAAFKEIMAKRGSDLETGRRLPSLFRQAGLAPEVRVDTIAVQGGSEHAVRSANFGGVFRDELIGSLGSQRYEALVEQAQAEVADPERTLVQGFLVQAWADVPEG